MRRNAWARASAMMRASCARRAGSAKSARLMVVSSSLARRVIRSRSDLRWSASPRVSAVWVDNSAGHSPPVTHGVQSTAEPNVGMIRDFRVALRRRWRAVLLPKIVTGADYRRAPFYVGRRAGRVGAAATGPVWLSEIKIPDKVPPARRPLDPRQVRIVSVEFDDLAAARLSCLAPGAVTRSGRHDVDQVAEAVKVAGVAGIEPGGVSVGGRRYQ